MTPNTVRAYQRLFAQEDGQRVLQDLLAYFGYTDRSTFDTDPHRMAYNEGQRSVLVHISTRMGVDADKLEDHEEDDDGTRAQL